MSIWSNLIKRSGTQLVKETSRLIDGLSTTDEEKLTAKNEFLDLVSNTLSRLNEQQKDVLIIELKGNWLQRSWRPITMLIFTLLIVVGAFYPIPYLENDSKFWTLLEIGLGGYVIGRSIEKIVPQIVNQSNVALLNKKDRKAFLSKEDVN